MFMFLLAGCGEKAVETSSTKSVPHENRWGIYSLDLSTENIDLIYSGADQLTGLRLNNDGDRFVFSRKSDTGEAIDTSEEIMSLNVDGTDLVQLTDDENMDTYPAWSDDGGLIYFLSFSDKDLDIYVMNADGSGERMFFDSGSHDADVHAVGDKIVFTSGSKIWIMNHDGTDAVSLTDPARAGEWGNAVLPFGDYDPRLSPDGGAIVFERLENDDTVHGNYNLFLVNPDGTGEVRLTDNGYTQGLASWSNSGDRLVYVVSAMGEAGKYDLYMMDGDGSNNHDIMPDYAPPGFLAHSAVFSEDDSMIYLIGEWWS